MKIISLLRRHLPFVSYLVFYFVLLAHKLITKPMPFFDWDESIYSRVGIEMLNNWSLVPIWQGMTWLDKPPLVPLFYGLVIKLLPFIQPEISVRISTLLLAIIAFIFIYALYYKVIKETWLTTLVIIICSITPIMMQRSQLGNIDVFLLLGWTGYMLFYKRFWLSLFFLAVAVMSKSLVGFYPVGIMMQRSQLGNIDVFLLLGWTGYMLFYKRFWLSLFFLAVAVMSKSLVGFYPVGIMMLYHVYLFFTKQIKQNEFKTEITKLLIHTGILLMWYVIMLFIYGKDFFIQHVYESHMKRVTDSIESHFGKRTFYIDILFEQYGTYAWASIVGLAILIWDWYKKKIKNEEFLNSTFLLPWFLFLNLTKTKIFWYGYPYISQFAFLMVYPFILLKKYISQQLYYIAVIVLIAMVLRYGFVDKKVHADQYASYDSHHKIAQLAKIQCDSLHVLVEPFDREAKATLEGMDLTITTTKWWGNHPSMVYYYDGYVDYIYTVSRFNEIMKQGEKNSCVVVTDEDLKLAQEGPRLIKKQGTMSLFKF